MKTRAGDLLLSQQTQGKRARVTLPSNALEVLPAEMWLEIFKHADKRVLRLIANICSDFHRLSHHGHLLADAPMPAVDYRLFRPRKSSHFYFEARAGQWWEAHHRNIYSLANGDVALGLDDGRLIVLPLRSLTWQLFGKHQRIDDDGDLIDLPVGDVIALRSGDIASICDDGVWIWDRKSARQKYSVILPSRYALIMNFYMTLIELPNGHLLAGCSDGSVHLLKLTNTLEGKRFQHAFTFPMVEPGNPTFRLLKKLIVKQNEIIAEFNDCLLRWSLTGQLIERITIADIKKLIAPLYQGNLAHANLSFDWGLPLGYVGVSAYGRMNLINLFNRNIAPCHLGKVDRYVITTSGDLVVVSEQDEIYRDIRAGWNPVNNQFSITLGHVLINHHACFLLTDGRLLIQNALGNLTILDVYRHQQQDVQLRFPRGVRPISISKVLKNGDLLMFDSCGLMVFDLATGRCKRRIVLNCWELTELANGDLLNQRRTLSIFSRPPLPPGMDVDHLEVVRFGLKR